MTIGSDFRASLPNMGSSHARDTLSLDADGLGNHPRMFKKHKTLPHPRKEDLQRASLGTYDLRSERPLSQNGGSPAPSPSGRRRSNRAGRVPDPPPTPPAHSRTLTTSHPVDSLNRKSTNSPPRSSEDDEPPPPATPPNQTPPTPNLTPDRSPPGPAVSQPQRRPPISSRNPSKVTTGSRSESFTTAREEPYSSGDDEERPTSRPALPSTRTSQSTLRQISEEPKAKSQPVGLGLGLESSPGNSTTPRTTVQFEKCEEERVAKKPAASEPDGEWDPSLMRNVTIRKRRPTRSRDRKQVISDDMSVGPTNATTALRSMSLQESPILYPSHRVVSERLPARDAPSNSEASISVDVKRSSVMSTRSNTSTVVEAILMENAPQRRKTLRHVRKQTALRDSGSDLSPASSAPTSVTTTADDPRQRQVSTSRADEAMRDSHVSTATFNSISSRKARREVWKNGGVPVVVIPERRTSVKSSKSPSLRSTSSRRSRSVSSIPVSQPSKSREHVSHFERQSLRNRGYSESDGSRPGDERTMDFPPVIPTRSSSLSAPTSRNASRTGSLTAESLRAHNMFQAQQAHQAFQQASRALEKLHVQGQPPAGGDTSHDWNGAETLTVGAEIERSQPTVAVERAPEDEQRELGENSARVNREQDPRKTPEMNGGNGVDRDGDPFFGKRLSVQNTPFSVASIDTTGTSHAEVSEAMAVNIYPHQSKSVVLVNHSAKPSESSSLEQSKPSAPIVPILKTTDANGGVPITPPQQFSVDDIDSPLRNPRAPPKPPAINFIPATPSGLTPSTEKEKQLGNYYEMTEEKPKRSLSLLRQTLTRRRTEYGPSPPRPVGFLKRTFSLSRNTRHRPDDWYDERPRLKRHSTADDVPADETRLHPFWRPAYADDEVNSDEDHDPESPEDEDRTYRYPLVDNRPSLPPPRRTRSLSARLRRTFAILPLRNDHYDYYPATSNNAPDRRTIRRTPSGNLRVMKFRRSMESLTRSAAGDGWPYTSPDQQQPQTQSRGRALSRRYTRLLRSLSLKARLTRASSTAEPALRTARPGTGGGFLPTLGDKINIPRRLSERRREKRTQELRGMISAPREVRDGMGDVIRRNSWRGQGEDQDHIYVREQQMERRRERLRERQGQI
ncbi:hypothetical protein VTI74DRAFT_3776 [Chaetomium olivicolor]